MFTHFFNAILSFFLYIKGKSTNVSSAKKPAKKDIVVKTSDTEDILFNVFSTFEKKINHTKQVDL